MAREVLHSVTATIACVIELSALRGLGFVEVCWGLLRLVEVCTCVLLGIQVFQHRALCSWISVC